MKTYSPVNIRIVEIDESKTQPIPNEALYKIFIELNQYPSIDWADLFIQCWNHPPQFTSMHKPSIASIQGKYIVLDGTTADEIQQYHKDTLKLVLAETNKNYNSMMEKETERLNKEEEQKNKNINEEKEKQKGIKFD